jgi:hypothetical protein
MLIEYDKYKTKTVKFDKFLNYEYRLLKKILKEILLCDDNHYTNINFDIYRIKEYEYYYIIKLIKFVTKIGQELMDKTEFINLYSTNDNKTLYDIIFSVISTDDLSKKFIINYIDNEINWNKTKSSDNIIYNNLENNFIII